MAKNSQVTINWIDKERPGKFAKVAALIAKKRPGFTEAQLREAFLKSSLKPDWFTITAAAKIASWIDEQLLG